MQNGSGWSLVESPSTAFFDDFEDNDDPEAKPTGSYAISTLEVHNGAFHFTYLATFLSYITPHELPVGKFILPDVPDEIPGIVPWLTFSGKSLVLQNSSEMSFAPESPFPN